MSKSTVGTATRTLRKLSIQNRFLLFEDMKIENPAEGDQWGFLCSLSQPQLSEPCLDFDPAFSPTPGDIEIISQSSPQLRTIKLRMKNRRGFNIAPPSKEKNVSYDLEWLYMSSSEAKHKVARDIDTIMCSEPHILIFSMWISGCLGSARLVIARRRTVGIRGVADH